MATMKIVFEFVEPNGSTFNEVYYSNDGSIAGAFPSDGLINARCNLLAPLVNFARVRVADIEQLRVTGVKVLNRPGTATLADATLLAPVPDGVAAICSLNGKDGGQRRLWMRGIPDGYLGKSPVTGRDAPGAFFLDLLAQFSQRLSGNSYGILRITAPSRLPSAEQPKTITAIAPVAGKAATIITTVEDVLVNVGDRVLIGRASPKDSPGLNGRWICLTGTGGKQIVIPYQCAGNLGPAIVTGQVRKFAYRPVSVFDGRAQIFSNYGTRVTKDPTTHTRGARRAVRLRTSL